MMCALCLVIGMLLAFTIDFIAGIVWSKVQRRLNERDE